MSARPHIFDAAHLAPLELRHDGYTLQRAVSEGMIDGLTTAPVLYVDRTAPQPSLVACIESRIDRLSTTVEAMSHISAEESTRPIGELADVLYAQCQEIQTLFSSLVEQLVAGWEEALELSKAQESGR